MRDGAIMANSGHFDAELDLKALREMAEGHVRDARENVQEFDLGGKRINLIAEGRLVNLGAAEGHPAAVMDMSFANQALSAEYVAKHHAELSPQVYVVPERSTRGRAAEARGARDHARSDDAGAARVRVVLAARHLRGTVRPPAVAGPE
jgi:adenosylhomocysteinase